MSINRDIVNASVDRLLAQYAEYVLLDNVVTEAKVAYEKRMIAIVKERGISLAEIASIIQIDDEAQTYASKREYWLRLCNRIADEMTFPSPLVWMLYKARAYAGTPQEITTWSAFRSHCHPTGYICTKRYTFLREAVRKHCDIDIDDIAATTLLTDACDMPWLQTVMEKPEVMGEWLRHEFHIRENRVAKWEDMP